MVKAKCVIHYINKNYSTHTQFRASVSEGDLDGHSIYATKFGFPTERSSRGFAKRRKDYC